MHRERRDEMRVGGNTVSGSVITLIQYRLFIVGVQLQAPYSHRLVPTYLGPEVSEHVEIPNA